jgi:hypothetical protein
MTQPTNTSLCVLTEKKLRSADEFLCSDQEKVILRTREKATRLDDAHERATDRRTTLQEEKSTLRASISAFRDRYAMNSAQAAENAAAWFRQLEDYQHRFLEVAKSRKQRELNFKLRELLEGKNATTHSCPDRIIRTIISRLFRWNRIFGEAQS